MKNEWLCWQAPGSPQVGPLLKEGSQLWSPPSLRGEEEVRVVDASPMGVSESGREMPFAVKSGACRLPSGGRLLGETLVALGQWPGLCSVGTGKICKLVMTFESRLYTRKV